MSETLVTETAKKSVAKSRQRKPRPSELDEFKAWLSGLGFQSPPKIHVNGAAYTTAVVVVDFGTPLAEPYKLTPEQSAELIAYMRSTTKSLFKDREVTARVQSDSNTGIWWSNVA
jgi:hypothetical protein